MSVESSEDASVPAGSRRWFRGLFAVFLVWLVLLAILVLTRSNTPLVNQKQIRRADLVIVATLPASGHTVSITEVLGGNPLQEIVIENLDELQSVEGPQIIPLFRTGATTGKIVTIQLQGDKRPQTYPVTETTRRDVATALARGRLAG